MLFVCCLILLLDPGCRGSEFCNVPLKNDFCVRKKLTYLDLNSKLCILNLCLVVLPFTLCFILKPPGISPPQLHEEFNGQPRIWMDFYIHILGLISSATCIEGFYSYLSECSASHSICPLIPPICQAIALCSLRYLLTEECPQAQCCKFTTFNLLQSLLHE